MILAQLAPTANTDTKLYQLESLRELTLLLLTVCNTTSGSQTFSIAFVPNGESLTTKHYVKKDQSIAAKTTVDIVALPTLFLLDSINVRASDAGVVFGLFN